MNELDFLRQENRKLRDQLDHAQKLITTPVRNMTELELRVQEQQEMVQSLEKELIEVFRLGEQIMSAITRTVTISIREMAQAFCEMDCKQQAEFFNEIAKDVQETWEAPFSAQVKFIRENEVLTKEGRKIMESFGEKF